MGQLALPRLPRESQALRGSGIPGLENRETWGTRRVTPAMEAGISNHVWTIEELCALLPKLASSNRLAEKQMVVATLNGQVEHK